MPFGLRNGPPVFQRFMDKVLGRYKWQIALVYVDDIIIFSNNFNSHLNNIETILQCIIKSRVTLSPTKSHVAYQSIEALGHSISNIGNGTAPNNTAAISAMPVPTTVKELQCFLGMCTCYRRFVQNLASIAAPLHALLNKDTSWNWSAACQQAFEDLCNRLVSTPILAHPDYQRPFIVYTDASTIGLGAVLAQLDKEHKEHTTAYLSRSLTAAEKNYTASELECLGIVWAVNKLQPYIDGSPFTLITDHSALQWLFDFKGNNRRSLRWSMELQPYRGLMTIQHQAGQCHKTISLLSDIRNTFSR
jgi:hypothetical protein